MSIAANVAFSLTARHYYILSKLQSLEPTFSQRYREDNATTLAGKSLPLVILFGDSRAQNWLPPPHLPGYRVINRGIGGETTAQMFYRFKADVLDLHPAVVIIQAGINDLVAADLSSSHTASYGAVTVHNLTRMVQDAKDSGIKVILFSITPPASPGLLRRFIWSPRIGPMVNDANRELLVFTIHHVCKYLTPCLSCRLP